MGTDGACGLLFCAAKRSGAFPPNMPAGLRARVSRLGGFTRPPSAVTGMGFLKFRYLLLPALIPRVERTGPIRIPRPSCVAYPMAHLVR
jgi:hypothetical protein